MLDKPLDNPLAVKHNGGMKKRKQLPRDMNQRAKAIVDLATDESAPEENQDAPAKNPAAVELGRLGGLKGGKARAGKLSKKRRSEIAKQAARARWNEQRRAERKRP
jgi:hypothetical protein